MSGGEQLRDYLYIVSYTMLQIGAKHMLIKLLIVVVVIQDQ